MRAALDAVEIRVADLARSLRFYRSSLGLPVHFSDTLAGPVAMCELGGVHVILLPGRMADKLGEPVTLRLLVMDLSVEVERLARQGTPAAPDPSGSSWILLDPDGNRIILTGRREPSR